MEAFVISQSEALLIGRCLELYLQQQSDYESTRFTDRLTEDVSPFLPPLAKSTTTRKHDELYLSIEWAESTLDGLEVGYAHDHPKSVFFRGEKVLVEIGKNETARHFSILVIDLLRDVLDPSLEAVRNTLPPSEWARKTFESYRQQAEQSAESFDEHPNEIERRIIRLVQASENQYQDAFFCGRKLGSLEAAFRRGIVAADSQLDWVHDIVTDGQLGGARPSGGWSASRPADYLAHATTALHSLLQSGQLLRGSVSESLLQQMKVELQCQIDQLSDEDDEDFEEHVDRSLELLEDRLDDCLADSHLCYERIHYVKFAAGELIGHVNGPAESSLTPARLQVQLRKLSSSSQPDRIREQMDLAWKIFEAGGEETALAPMIVSSLGGAIEALAKRIWPDDFPEKLGSVLHSHLHSGSDEEKRFASVGLNLHSKYRNPVQHQADTISLQLSEAVYYCHGINALLDLSNQIVASRREGP